MTKAKRKIRIVDYVANPGGGVRFVIELLQALVDRSDFSYELVSHGNALRRYRSLLERSRIRVQLSDIPPANNPRLDPKVWHRIPGNALMLRLVGRTIPWTIRVPQRAFGDCDLVWFPWIHRHEADWNTRTPLVATFHDTIGLQFSGVWPVAAQTTEHELMKRWFASDARILVTSKSTTESLKFLFGQEPSRFQVIRLTGMHSASPLERVQPTERWEWMHKPYILCPANVSPHKNHETLLQAVAKWEAAIPIVLVGSGTDWNSKAREGDARQRVLRNLDAKLQLSSRGKILGLGYVDDATYFALLSNAWALVMPTLAEGGGSFPVGEAILRGIPAICTDIPVMQEFVEVNEGKVWMFKAQCQDELAARLNEFVESYDQIKSEAVEASKSLAFDTWGIVAEKYVRVFSQPFTLG
ncbi:MAG: glycosyltransferase [Pirellulaceae bacterium]